MVHEVWVSIPKNAVVHIEKNPILKRFESIKWASMMTNTNEQYTLENDTHNADSDDLDGVDYFDN